MFTSWGMHSSWEQTGKTLSMLVLTAFSFCLRVRKLFLQLLENFHLVFQRHDPPPPLNTCLAREQDAHRLRPAPGSLSPYPSRSGVHHSRCREPRFRARGPPPRPFNLRLVLILTTPLAGHLPSLRSQWDRSKQTGESDCKTNWAAPNMTPHCDPVTTSDPSQPRSREAWQPPSARCPAAPQLYWCRPGRFGPAKTRGRESAPGRSREAWKSAPGAGSREPGGLTGEPRREGASWRPRRCRCWGRCLGWKRRWRSCALCSRCCSRCLSASSASKRRNCALARFSPCSTSTIGEMTLQLERGRATPPSMETGMGVVVTGEAFPSRSEGWLSLKFQRGKDPGLRV